MFTKLYELPKLKRHLCSLAISVLCMAAAVGISSIYYYTHNENSTNVTLIFTLFVILVSCSTTGYIYGILCSLFSMLWFNYMYAYPYFKLNFTLSGYPITFLMMALITAIISTLTSRLIINVRLVSKHERRLAEAENEKMRANLLRAISHDLRTPLSGIIGNSSVYCNSYTSLNDAEKLDLVNNIHEDATWLYNMVENLLTVTRIRNDDLTIKTSIESVEEVVGESIMRITKRHPDCELNVRFPEDFIMLPMDAILIEQVIINLIENAIQHSGSTAPVDLIVEDSPNEVSFTIRDFGNGIPENMLNSLFDGTSYSAPHTADVQKGIGIGLVICKTIINAHRGTIVGMNHGNGAQFIFTLPKQKEE